MNFPDYQGKACDAVVRHLEKTTGETREEIRFPERDGVGPPVDLRLRLGAREYAIEHTRIEPFENQIEAGVTFNQINDCIKERISDSLPRPAYYELHIPFGIRLPKTQKKRGRALHNLVEWIRASALHMHKRNTSRSGPTRSPVRADACIKGTPTGLNCEIGLLRWPDAALIRGKLEHFRINSAYILSL